MKTNVFTLLAVSLLLVPSIGNADYTNEFVAYWACEEESGVRYDSGTNNNDLTDNNTVGFGTGINGNGCDVEYSNSEYFTILEADATGLHAFDEFLSFSFWVKLETLPSVLGQQVTFAYTYYSGGIKNGYQLMVDTSDKLHLRYWGASADSYIGDPSATFVSGDIGNWVHIAVSVNVASTTGVLYKDDVARGFNMIRSSSNSTGVSTSVLNIFSAGALQYSDALFDEFMILPIELSATDIEELYNNGDGFFYPFSTTSTSTASTTTTTTTTVDFAELKSMIEMYLALFSFALFTFLGYKLTKIFV